VALRRQAIGGNQYGHRPVSPKAASFAATGSLPLATRPPFGSESPAPLGGTGEDVPTALVVAQTAAGLDLPGGNGRQFARKG
jgi:hypothetical protein